MSRKKRKSNNPEGRLSARLAEASVLVTGPAELLASVRAAAEREGVPVREWWRRAAKSRLEGKLPEGKR